MDNAESSYRRFLDGDESAFDQIMVLLFDNLVFFINRYLHDLPASEDIAMDVFADLIVKKHRYNFKVSLKTYLFMLGRSRALNYIKRRKKLDLRPSYDGEIGESAEITAEMNLTKQKINEVLSQLTPDRQMAVYLVYFEDLSYEEAAQVMKKNKKQIDYLLYSAKKELKELLGKDGELI